MKNPYVGPRSFTEQEREMFFGREREARDLYSQVVSHRLVMFYAQSGAGKTSLLQTSLIPQLRDNDFSVLPICRVAGSQQEELEHIDNIYIFNLMLSLDQGNTDPSKLAKLQLSEFLSHLVSEDGEHFYYDPDMDDEDDDDEEEGAAYVLILDQFEELLSTHHERWRDRAEFFQQLNQAMVEDKFLWVVLSLREDYVASLDPYIPLMRDRLRDRYYMQRMEQHSALIAIQQPAILAGKSFASGVAEQLVDNLRQIKQGHNKENTQQKGQYIEPVQLQVVCFQLWKKLEGDQRKEITEKDLQQKGDIDSALSDFYEQTLSQTLQNFGVPESECRQWFDRQLITEAGTRGTVFRGESHSGGMSNDVVEELADHYIIRAESRSGSIWYELVHDRFIDPILQANQCWLNSRPLLRDARHWVNTGKGNDHLLYQGQQLAEAIEQNKGKYEPTIEVFLEASAKLEAQRQKEEQARERERLANRRFRTWFKIASAVAMLAVLSSVWAAYEKRQSYQAEIEAVQAKNKAEAATVKANHNIGLALNEKAMQSLRGEHRLLHKLYSLYALNSLSMEINPEISHEILERIQLHPVHVAEYMFQASNQHDGPINALAYSNDGALLLSASSDQSVRLWNVNSGKQTHAFVGHKSVVTSAVFSPDNHQIASASWDKTVRLWNVQSGQQTAVLRGHEFTVQDVCYAPDGKVLASSSWDQTIRLWDIASQQQLYRLDGHQARISKIVFSPDGQRLASAAEDGEIIIWDRNTGQALPSPEGHMDAVSDMLFSADGKTLISSSRDGTIIFWDMNNAEELRVLESSHGAIMHLALSSDGNYLASATIDHQLQLWDANSGILRQQLQGHDDAITSVVFSTDNTQLFSASNDQSIRSWSTSTGKQLHVFRGHSAAVKHIRLSPDGQYLASASDDDTIRLWNRQQGIQIQPFTGHSKEISAIVFSPDGRYFATGSKDNSIRLWDVQKGKRLQSFLGHDDAISAMMFSPDGTTLASASEDMTVRLWDIQTGKEKLRFTQHQDAVNTLNYSHNGNYLVSTSSDGAVYLWQQDDGTVIQQLLTADQSIGKVIFSADDTLLAGMSYHGDVILWSTISGKRINQKEDNGSARLVDIAFSPDGKKLASVTDRDIIDLRDGSNGTWLDSFELHGASHYGIHFSPTGDIIHLSDDIEDTLLLGAYSPASDDFAIASEDHHIRIYHAQAKQPYQLLQGHRKDVNQITLSPNGRYLVTSSNDQSIAVWDLHRGQHLNHVDLLNTYGALPTALSFSSDGKQLSILSDDGYSNTWNIDHKRITRRTSGMVINDNVIGSNALTRNGKHLAVDVFKHYFTRWNDAERQELMRLITGDQKIISFSFSNNDQLFAFVANDNAIHVRRMKSGKSLQRFTAHTDLVEKVVFSPNSQLLASVSLDKTIRLWDLAKGKQLSVFANHQGYINDIAFSADGKTLVSASDDQTILLWDLNANKKQLRISGHDGAVKAVAISSNGKLLASASDDHVIRLWDANNGKQLQLLKGHKGVITDLVFSPDSRTLASTAKDGTVRVWASSPAKLHSLANIRDHFNEISSAYPYQLNVLSLEYVSSTPSLFAEYPLITTYNHELLNYWLEAARQGHAQAMYQVALQYDHAQNNVQAMLWYKKAAQAGSFLAQKHLRSQ